LSLQAPALDGFGPELRIVYTGQVAMGVFAQWPIGMCLLKLDCTTDARPLTALGQIRENTS
jgi:hypothetical protein